MMMQLARRASLVVLLLLTSVGTASAECAWVLWSYYQTKEQGSFRHERSIVRAYESKRECEQAVPEQVQSHIKTWSTVYDSATASPVDPAVVTARKRREAAQDDDSLLVRVSCWPLGLEPKSVLGGAEYREAGAWVTWAWIKSLPSGRIFWDIMPYAFQTKSECEADASKREAEYKKKGDSRWDRTFICFPAGTDPRQPTEITR